MNAKRYLTLLLLILLVAGGGLAIGFVFKPGTWYARLHKPEFNPPSWVFGPVWTILYVLIAVAGWRIFERGQQTMLWSTQLALNFLWSPVFFGAHQVGLALIVILLLLATILALIVALWLQDRVTAWLLMPYAAWVAFAGVLNGAIWRLN